MKNKKGLSGIVTTLIIILLVLASVGLIWRPVSDLLTGGTSSLDKNTLCLGMDIQATKVTKISAADTAYNVTIFRRATGPEQEAGVKLVLFNDNTNTDVLTSIATKTWAQLRTDVFEINAVDSGGMTNGNKVRITPFFISEDTGKEIICDQSTEFKFTPII